MNLRLKWLPLTKVIFLGALASVTVLNGCNKRVVQASSSVKVDDTAIKLGEGFDDLYYKFNDSTCIDYVLDPDADKVRSRVEQYFGKVEDIRETLNHQGISGDGSFTYGIAKGNTKMQLIQNAQSTERSISFLQWTKIISKTARAMEPKLKAKYSREKCGNKYVNSISLGAEMHVLVTLSFSTSKYLRVFEQSAGVKFGGWGELNARVDKVNSDVKKHASITLRRSSSGDNLDHLSTFFKGRDFVTCSLDNFAECQNLMADIITYMNGPFAADAVQSNTVINHELTDYPGQSFPVDEKVTQERNALSDLINKQVRDKMRATSLVNSGYLLPEDLPTFQNLADDLSRNIDTIKSAIVRCYDSPKECGNPVNLKPYNPESLISVHGAQVVNVSGSITNVTECDRDQWIIDQLVKNCRSWHANNAPGEVEKIEVGKDDIIKEYYWKKKTDTFNPDRQCRRTVDEARCKIYVRL